MIWDTGHAPVHRLRDGTAVRLRMIGPADRIRLAEGFEKLSAESRYRRFFQPVPRLTEAMLRRLTETDGQDHVAIGAEILADEPDDGEGVGVGRFVRLREAADTAEAAVAVIDAKQGLGLGHLLMRALVEAARERGIARFRGYVLRDNERARALLEGLEGHVTVRDEGEFLVYEVELPESAEDLTGGGLHRLLRLAAQGVQFVFERLAALG